MDISHFFRYFQHLIMENHLLLRFVLLPILFGLSILGIIIVFYGFRYLFRKHNDVKYEKYNPKYGFCFIKKSHIKKKTVA